MPYLEFQGCGSKENWTKCVDEKTSDQVLTLMHADTQRENRN